MSAQILEANAQVLEKFLLLNPQLKESTKQNYRFSIRSFSNFVKKPFRDVTIEDIVLFLNAQKTQSARCNYLWRIRRFLKWVYDGDLPRSIERYRTRRVQNKIMPDDLLTVEEVRRLMDNCSSLRDLTILAVLYHTGARIREILNTRESDIIEHKGVPHLKIDGKNGEFLRGLPKEVIPYLEKWINYFNPQKDDFLFPTHNNPHKPLSYSAWRYTLKKIVERAGISKRVHSHLFRHMANTRLVRKVGKDKAKMIMGYAKSSNIIDTYTHLTDDDRLNAFCESDGLPPLGSTPPEELPEQKYAHFLTRDVEQRIQELEHQLNEMTDKLLHVLKKHPDYPKP